MYVYHVFIISALDRLHLTLRPAVFFIVIVSVTIAIADLRLSGFFEIRFSEDAWCVQVSTKGNNEKRRKLGR